MYQYEYGTILSLLDIAGIPHKRVGNRHMGVCPVCGNGYRTPCCSYSLEKNLWKCFSCGEGGGIKKLKEYLNLNVNLKNFVSGVKAQETYKPSNITESVKPYVSKKPDKESLQYLKSRRIDYQRVAKFVRFISPKKKWHFQNGYRLLIPSFDKEGFVMYFLQKKEKNLDLK